MREREGEMERGREGEREKKTEAGRVEREMCGFSQDRIGMRRGHRLAFLERRSSI